MNEIIITRKADVIPEYENEHQPYEYYKHIVAGAAAGNQCTVNFYELPPGKSSFPYHYHTANEEIFYLISGTGLLRTPDGEKTVQAGDVIIFPTGEKGAHKLTNLSETETLVYLDVDTNRFPEIVYYPDSNKIGVKASGEMKNIYMDTDVGYYAGE